MLLCVNIEHSVIVLDKPMTAINIYIYISSLLLCVNIEQNIIVLDKPMTAGGILLFGSAYNGYVVV